MDIVIQRKEVHMFLTKRKKIFYVCYKDPDKNKWQRQTTGEKDWEKAKKFMLEFEKNHQFTNVMIEDVSHKRTLKNFINKFLEYAKNNTRESTYANYFRALNNFLSYIGDIQLENIKIQDIENFKVKRKIETSTVTANDEIKIIKACYKRGIKLGIIDKSLDVAQYIDKFSEPEKEPIAMNEKQINKLLSVMNESFKRLIRFALYTGLRRAEILNLEWEDIDFKNKTIRIHNKANFKTKTGKVRAIPLEDDLMDILMTKVDKYGNTGYVFRNPQGQKYANQYISNRFKYYLRKAELPEKFHFHCLRHTFITDLVNDGVPTAQVQRMAGHSNITTTLLYTHLNVNDLRKYYQTRKY